MRMIDQFRTPTQCGIISALERIKMGTAHDIELAMGIGDTYHKTRLPTRHLSKLVDDEVIHICGYVGSRNRRVYALLYKEEVDE